MRFGLIVDNAETKMELSELTTEGRPFDWELLGPHSQDSAEGNLEEGNRPIDAIVSGTGR